jgi:hypothetical protein
LARRGKQRPWWSFAFTHVAVACGSIAFAVALLDPLSEIVKYTSKHGHLRASMTPDQAEHLAHLERDWSEGVYLYRSTCLGVSVLVVMMTGRYLTRRLRKRGKPPSVTSLPTRGVG